MVYLDDRAVRFTGEWDDAIIAISGRWCPTAPVLCRVSRESLGQLRTLRGYGLVRDSSFIAFTFARW